MHSMQMSTQTESSGTTQGWSTIDVDVLGRVARAFKDGSYWRCLAPRLRLVNKHWRRAVDAHGMHLSMRKLPDYPLCRHLQRICRENTVTSLASYPQYGRLSFLSSLWEQNLLPKLQSLSVLCADNADAVLYGTQFWRSSLRRLELTKCIVTQNGLDALTNLVNVTDLRLHYVDHSEKEIYDIGCLGNMSQLRRLSFADYTINRCFGFVSLLTGLETLEIISRARRVSGLSAIEECAGLRELRLSKESDPTSVDFISRMTQLTALALHYKDVHDVSFSPHRSIRSLGFLIMHSQKLKEEFRGALSPWISMGLVNVRDDALGDLFARGHLDTNMPLTESLTSLNSVGYKIVPQTFRKLAAFRHLQQIRMHLSAEPDFLDRNMKDVVFPHVTLWTIDMDWVNAGVFAAKAMPSLKKLGILIRGRLDNRFCFEHLTLLTGLEHINIARGESCENAYFWESMQKAFEKLPVLEHLGWKPQRPNVSAIPEELMDIFAKKNVVVDDDYSILLDD